MPKWGQNWGTDTEWRFSLRELTDVENLVRELKASKVVEGLHVAAKGGCIDDGWLELIIGALDVNESLKILNVNFHTFPSGWQSFCDALKRNRTLTVLNLGDHKFGDEQALVLREALAVNSALTRLNVRNCKVGAAGLTSIAEGLRTNTTLEKMYIGDNQVLDAGVTALAKVFEVNTTLKKLDLSKSGVGPRGTTALAEALKSSSTLSSLYFEHNAIGDEGATALANSLDASMSLKALHLKECTIGDGGLSILASSLNRNTTLEVLSLGQNKLGNPFGKALSDSLLNNRTLKSLELRGCCFATRGWRNFSDALGLNDALEELSLADVKMPDAGAEVFGRALGQNSGLTKLEISNCHTSASGMCHIAGSIIVNTTLEDMCIGRRACASMQDSAIPPWGAEYGDAVARAVGNALKVNTKLKILTITPFTFCHRIWDSCIGPEGMTSLADALQSNTTLQQIMIPTPCGDEGLGAVAFAESLGINRTLTSVSLEGCGMVEKGARALGIAWGMNMGLGTLRMNGFTEGIKRLKKLMEEEAKQIWRREKLLVFGLGISPRLSQGDDGGQGCTFKGMNQDVFRLVGEAYTC